MRRMLATRLLVLAVLVAPPSGAAVQVYDSSRANGAPGDFIVFQSTSCPPLQTAEGFVGGSARLTDLAAGSVTLEDLTVALDRQVVLGPDLLTQTFGPGAFIFVDSRYSASTVDPAVSNATGIGAHGPSSAAPGGRVEWGVISGWEATGFEICLSSPVTICNSAAFVVQGTVLPTVPSQSYDLGTWNFDAAGNYSSEAPYVFRAINGGLGIGNDRVTLRGALVGASLPVLPLFGFGALAVALAVAGLRALPGRSRS